MNAAWRYVSEWQQAVGVGTVHYRANNNPQKFADQPTKKVKFTPIYFCTSISIGWEANHWQPYMMKFAYWLHNFEEYIEYDTSLEHPAVHIPIVKCIVRRPKIFYCNTPHKLLSKCNPTERKHVRMNMHPISERPDIYHCAFDGSFISFGSL